MSEENKNSRITSQGLRLKNLNETRNHLIEEINLNELMSVKKNL